MDEEDLHVGDVIEEPGDASRENHSWGRGPGLGVYARARGSEGGGDWSGGRLSGRSRQRQVSKQGGRAGSPCSPQISFV